MCSFEIQLYIADKDVESNAAVIYLQYEITQVGNKAVRRSDMFSVPGYNIVANQ